MSSTELEPWIPDNKLPWDKSTMVQLKWPMSNQIRICLLIEDLIRLPPLFHQWVWNSSKSREQLFKVKPNPDHSLSILVLIIVRNNKLKSLTTHQSKETPQTDYPYKTLVANLRAMSLKSLISFEETSLNHKQPSSSLCFQPNSSSNSRWISKV